MKKNIAPVQSTLQLSVLDRMLSRSVTTEDPIFTGVQGGQAINDLLSDLFFELFKWDPVPLKPEHLPVMRIANAAIIQLLKSLDNWEEAKRFTTGSLAASLTSAELTWNHVLKDNLFKDLIEQQKQLEQAMQRAQAGREKQRQHQQDANDASEDGDNPGAQREQAMADQMGQQADASEQQAEQMAQQLAETAEQMTGNPFAQAALMQTAQRAADKALEIRKAEGLLKSWGSEAGGGMGVDKDSLERYLATLKKHGPLIQQIASVVGRAKEVAMRSGGFATKEVIATAAEVAPTQDLMSVFPDELAYLSVHSPPVLRASKVAEFVEEGLLGWIPKMDRKRRGAFTGLVDGSGSMSGTPWLIASGLMLAICELARSEGRRYNLEQFAAGHSPGQYFLSDSHDWEAHFRWATSMDDGGTDYDLAIRILMANVTKLRKLGLEGVDALFISDDACRLDPDTAQRWLKFKAENDVRLLYIAIGATGSGMYKLADKVLEFHNLDLDKSDEVAKVLGEWLTD